MIRQIESSAIPYPQRHFFRMEVESDLEHVAGEPFDEADLEELVKIHSTPFYRALENFGRARGTIEAAIAVLPLMMAGLYLSKEGNMIQFIREGGAAMYPILAIGAVLMFRELQNIFRLLVVRDHSQDNLRLDTSSVLVGCLALVLFGFGNSAMGLYVSAGAVFRDHLSYEIFLMGAKESLASAILSLSLAGLILLAHYATRRVLHLWSAPVLE